MSKLNFGKVDRCSVRLNTATLLGLKAAYDDFAKTGRICTTSRSASRTKVPRGSIRNRATTSSA
ncbi:hypothetical protein [Burkholderia cepacia]|uniref:hypothetical protein n=1 Tax=Burkholderia cepacia TaxID=292 RepID=UPI001CF5B617|nr:hypothetical protein [Burkholderia cepacia]MCA8115091.1 hypothetical protein [Burkholderia cepacia]MCA8401278.1 hypothetical protein [Burkholderia cepacia]